MDDLEKACFDMPWYHLIDEDRGEETATYIEDDISDGRSRIEQYIAGTECPQYSGLLDGHVYMPE